MFANRVHRVEPSPTVDVGNTAKRYRERGIELIDFGSADPDFTTPEVVRNAAKEAIDAGKTHYTHTTGIRELREAIVSKLESENGIPATPDEILVTPGSKQAVFESLLALVDRGDEVAIFDPAWTSYEPIVGLAGGSLERISMDPEDGFSLEEVEFESSITDDTEVIVINTPHNPTGSVFPMTVLERIRDLAIDHDCWVLSDEIYEKVVYDGAHHSIGSLDGMQERTVTVNGFSKSWAMGGWRLGYMHGPPSLIDQANKIHSYSVSCAPSFVQHAGVKALEVGDEALEPIYRTLQKRRDHLVETLGSNGIDIPKPQGTFLAFVPTDGDDLTVCNELLENEHVVTTPGSAFNWPGYLRVSYAVDIAQIDEGIDRIAPYLSDEGV